MIKLKLIVTAATSAALAVVARGAITTSGSASWSGTVGSSTLTLGSGASTGSAAVDSGGATITGLDVVSNTSSSSSLTITDGTLTTTGAVTVGANAVGALSNFQVTGTGTWLVSPAINVTFQVGGGTGSSGTAAVTSGTLDMNGLSAFSFSTTGNGKFAIGDVQTGVSTSTGPWTVNLANTSTISASELDIGNTKASTPATLNLGSASNIINVTNLYVGSTGTGNGSGTLQFYDSQNGTVKIRGANGTDPVSVMDVGYDTATTAGALTGTADFSGHLADVSVTTLNIGGRLSATNANPDVGITTASFVFDQGTLSAGTLNLGIHGTGYGTTALAQLTIGGGTVTIGNGGLMAAVNNSGGNSSHPSNAEGDILISGGTVSIGATTTATAVAPLNTSIVMGYSQNGFDKATAHLSLTGGTLNVAGNIINGGGAGTLTSTLLLSGGTLNLTGHNLGSSSAPITTTFQSGTLASAGLINTSGGITKTGAGMLVLSGTNSFTGSTAISSGILSADTTGTLNSSAGVSINGATAEFNYNNSTTAYSGGAITFTQGILSGTGTVNVGITGNANTTVAPGTTATNGKLTLGSTVSLGGGALAINLDKTGPASVVAGTDYDQLVVGGTSVDVSGGTLALSLGNSLAIDDVYYILDNQGGNSITGTFTNATINGLATTGSLGQDGTFAASGYQFEISYDAITGSSFDGAGNSIALQVVPEPALLSWSGVGITGLLIRRRRRRKS